MEIDILLLVVTIDKIHKEHLGTWKFAKKEYSRWVFACSKLTIDNEIGCGVRSGWHRFGICILNSENTSCVDNAEFVNVSTCWVVSVNLSKDAFYITYSDIKKRVCIDFIVHKVHIVHIVYKEE